MRRTWIAPLAVLALAVAAACGGESPTATVVVREVTPMATPTPTGEAGVGNGAGPPGSPSATAAPPALMLSTLEVHQAGAVLVSVTGPVASGSIAFLGRSYPLTKGSKSMFSFVGVDTEDPAGAQPLKVEFTQTNGSKGTLTDTITVLKTQWTVDSLQFSDTTSQLLDPEIVNDELALLHGIYTKVTPEKLWTNGWIAPVDGQLTARMGEQRSINGSAPSGHHGGTDLAAEVGTPVKAANGGCVVLARPLQVRGNMVIIDHGGGLFTGYAHLSEFRVSEGQTVQQGDIIGLSGATGLVTGPHLHWEMALDGLLLDALRFTDGSNGF